MKKKKKENLSKTVSENHDEIILSKKFLLAHLIPVPRPFARPPRSHREIKHRPSPSHHPLVVTAPDIVFIKVALVSKTRARVHACAYTRHSLRRRSRSANKWSR